jgi:drug/metabolite transporter (DMT)-like permease
VHCDVRVVRLDVHPTAGFTLHMPDARVSSISRSLTPMSISLIGFLYAIGAAITWGVVYTIDQQILKSASPFTLLFVSSLVTSILCLPFAVFQSRALSLLLQESCKSWLLIAGSLVLAGLANLFIFSSIRALGASTAATLEITYPFFVVLFSFFAFQIRPSPMFLVGVFLLFAGATVILMFGQP